MFVLRSLFWLGSVVLLLPPSADGQQPAPRLSLLQAAYATRVLAQDLTGVCERNPEACATSRDALALLTLNLETGVDIVAAGLAASRAADNPVADLPAAARGTLTSDDLQPAWSVAEVRP